MSSLDEVVRERCKVHLQAPFSGLGRRLRKVLQLVSQHSLRGDLSHSPRQISPAAD